MTDFSVI
jgi:FMS-like tyrosine kinase 1